MDRRIRLFWYFRGEDAFKTAEHHHHHLLEYIDIEKIDILQTGFDSINNDYAFSFMDIMEALVPIIKNDLRPQRAIILDEI